MMKKFVFAVAATAFFATGAAAQSPDANARKVQTESFRYPNSNIDREYGTKVRLSGDNKQLLFAATANSVARCLVRKAKEKGGELLGGPMTDDPQFKDLTRALTGRYRNCASSTPVPLLLINGALAEELVRIKQPSLQARAALADAAAAKAFYASSGGVTIDSLGRCVVVHSPSLAYRVLGTAAGSAAEAQALSDLFASNPKCGLRSPPKGIPAAEQRSAIATGLYHWTNRG